jgi:transcriptional regulator with XRE-family HTH domain
MSETLGERVLRVRNDLKISQEELAEKIGCPKTWVFKVEHDKMKNPGARYPKYLRKLCDVLGFNYDEIKEGDVNPNIETETALQIGTSVLDLIKKDSIPLKVTATKRCGVSLGLIFFPKISEEITKMLTDYDCRLVQVNGKDCHPYANENENLLVATDAEPKNGDQVLFEDSEHRCHIGIYHENNGKSVIVAPFNKGDIPMSDFRGVIVWRIQPVKRQP